MMNNYIPDVGYRSQSKIFYIYLIKTYILVDGEKKI